MPVLFEDENQVRTIVQKLNNHNIFPRRYFYPALNTIKAVAEYMSFPVAEDLASRILCLPLFYTLKKKEIEYICSLILNS
jgi:dTDP-4-amino-4,6-dideoxygalactose transaminase